MAGSADIHVTCEGQQRRSVSWQYTLFVLSFKWNAEKNLTYISGDTEKGNHNRRDQIMMQKKQE